MSHEKRKRRIKATRKSGKPEQAVTKRRRRKSEVRQIMQRKLQKQLELCEELEVKKNQLAAETEEAQEELLRLMQESGEHEVSNKIGKAEVEIPTGRAVTKVDAREFWDMVDEDDFFASVNVSVAEARKHLSEKELKSISETTPGTKKDPRLKLSVWGINAKK